MSTAGAETQMLTPQQRHAWLALLTVILRLPPALESTVRQAGDLLLVEFIVLSVLAESPDHRRRMTTIARESHLSASRTTHLVARLESRGLIVRGPAAGDGRAIQATITSAGLDLVELAAPAYESAVSARVFSRLTGTQVEELVRLSELIDTAPATTP